MNHPGWADAIRTYYEQKNQIWFQGGAGLSRMVASFRVHGCQEALLWYQRLARRRRTVLQSVTRVDTRRVRRQLTNGPGDPKSQKPASARLSTEKLWVDVLEHVQLLYRTGEDVGEERRIYPWRLALLPAGGTWRVVEERPLNDADRAVWGTSPQEQEGKSADRAPGWWRERWRKLFSFRRFDRLQVFKYAELWWDGYNPRFRAFRVDCTNFVSQCLWHGGFPMEPAERPEQGWWYAWKEGGEDRWSLSWAVSHSLYWYMVQKAREGKVRFVDLPGRLYVGDIILYDWNGDGTWQHAAVVVDFDPEGQPLVNAHTTASYHRLWDYGDSPAWTRETRYAFIHIEDG
ncbi:amidase domain-containing protein [Kyrpidia spormannii]|uniref:Putative amidase domain-containing protein n=1 Tax=Kyrpidia spormannii TaxID=2055160 RepID=A0A6F9EF62_9BACL|nr:amidase domain-containing protein [Kyrpidia spormannii]CAB3395134.1 conserved protein of unknown function [Kyrpidia spormannii]